MALVGENGAGKTTLVKLLCRFYEPTAGRITVDGLDLARIDVAAWRQRLAAAFQDYVRFELTARETVGVGDPPVLERDGDGLNLTEQVRDGILNHTGGSEPETLEGKIVRLVYRVAYINHDIDDAVRAGILAPEDLPRDEIELLFSRRDNALDCRDLATLASLHAPNCVLRSPMAGTVYGPAAIADVCGNAVFGPLICGRGPAKWGINCGSVTGVCDAPFGRHRATAKRGVDEPVNSLPHHSAICRIAQVWTLLANPMGGSPDAQRPSCGAVLGVAHASRR